MENNVWDTTAQSDMTHCNAVCVEGAGGLSMQLTRYCLTQWISKLPWSFEIHWVRQYLNETVFGIEEL